jgi:hypothetical protein
LGEVVVYQLKVITKSLNNWEIFYSMSNSILKKAILSLADQVNLHKIIIKGTKEGNSFFFNSDENSFTKSSFIM